MAADSNIFAQYLKPAKSMQDYTNDMDAAEQNKMALAAGRMKAQQDQQDLSDNNAFRALIAGGVDMNTPEGQARMYGVAPKRAGELLKSRADLKKTEAETTKALGDTEKQQREAADAHYNAYEMARSRFLSDPNITKQKVVGALNEMAAFGKLPAKLVEHMTANLPDDPNELRADIERGDLSRLSPKERMELFAPKWGFQGTGQKQVPVQSNPRAPGFNANQPLQMEATPGEVMRSDDAAKSRAQSAAQFGVTTGLQRERLNFEKSKPGAVEGKPMTAAQESKYRAQIAKDYQSANTNLANLDEVLTSIGEVRSAPGLKGATGLQSYIPSMPNSNAAQAEVKLKNLEGKITQLGKAAAAQGGAVGPMAVQEWKIVRDMIAAIEPQKGDKALLEQMALVESATQGAAARIRDAYEKQYGADFERYPQFQNIAAPKGAPKPAGVMSPEDTQAMDWANKNPNDPRSKQIKQRLGGG